MFYSSFLNKLTVFVQLSTQIQTHSSYFVKLLPEFGKFYPSPKIFYTNGICDKFQVWEFLEKKYTKCARNTTLSSCQNFFFFNLIPPFESSNICPIKTVEWSVYTSVVIRRCLRHMSSSVLVLQVYVKHKVIKTCPNLSQLTPINLVLSSEAVDTRL